MCCRMIDADGERARSCRSIDHTAALGAERLAAGDEARGGGEQRGRLPGHTGRGTELALTSKPK